MSSPERSKEKEETLVLEIAVITIRTREARWQAMALQEAHWGAEAADPSGEAGFGQVGTKYWVGSAGRKLGIGSWMPEGWDWQWNVLVFLHVLL